MRGAVCEDAQLVTRVPFRQASRKRPVPSHGSPGSRRLEGASGAAEPGGRKPVQTLNGPQSPQGMERGTRDPVSQHPRGAIRVASRNSNQRPNGRHQARRRRRRRLEALVGRLLDCKNKPIIGNFIAILSCKLCQLWVGRITLVGDMRCESTSIRS